MELVEAAGVEPASEAASLGISTSVFVILISPWEAPLGGILLGQPRCKSRAGPWRPRLASRLFGTAPRPAGLAWGTGTAYGIYDASTSGNLLAWADLDTPNTIAAGNTVQFGVNGITITLD